MTRKPRVDPELALTLGRFQDNYEIARQAAFHDVDFPRLRDRITHIRQEAVADLPGLADRFEAAASPRGVVVHRARDGAAVLDIVEEISRAHGAKMIVKSKSMTTEEIDLNSLLSRRGLECVETDLGEWIIQLAGDRPSHMVAPAIHLDRLGVARIMSGAVGRDVPPEIEYMVKLARAELRKAFLAADLGMTGANMLVGDRGMVVMVTNEGNGRLVVTMPPVHVVVAGYEKLIGESSSVPHILRGLCRGATGQHITSYVNMIGAPSGGGSAVLAGAPVTPEMHVILLDAGRLSAAGGPLSTGLQCIRCGSCANVCPVYSRVGGHVMGKVLAGPIGVILGPLLKGQSDGSHNLCLGCGRCHEVCPAGVGIPDLMLRLRTMFPASSVERGALRTVLSRPRLMDAGARVLGMAQRATGAGDGYTLPGGRHVPRVAKEPFAPGPGRESGPTVAFYAGCLSRYVYPEIGQAVWDLFDQAGYRVVYPPGQLCCGAPSLFSGDTRTASDLLRTTISALLSCRPDHVITPCPTCTWVLSMLAPGLLDGDEDARLLAGITRDFSAAAGELLPGPLPEVQASRSWKVTYHDSCHLRWKMGVWEEPRSIIKSLPGASYVEMDHADRCCGFGGSYAMKQPHISNSIRSSKLDSCRDAGAVVVTACPGCLLHLRDGARRETPGVKIQHLATVLAHFQPGGRGEGPPGS